MSGWAPWGACGRPKKWPRAGGVTPLQKIYPNWIPQQYEQFKKSRFGEPGWCRMDRHRDAIHNGGVERSRALIWTIFVTFYVKMHGLAILIGHIIDPRRSLYNLCESAGVLRGNSSSKIESGLPDR